MYNRSGVRSGTILTLPKDQAMDWIAREWCDRVEEEKPTQKKNHDQEG